MTQADANPGTLLCRQRYSDDLQQAFAILSGDYNPMHVDPVAARRTLVGGQAVHGIHQTLTALEAVLGSSLRKKEPDRSITGFTVKFLKPVLLDDVVAFHLDKSTDESCLVTGRIAGETICKISVQFGKAAPRSSAPLPPLPTNEPVAELHLNEAAGKTGTLVLALDASLSKQLFPLTTANLGMDGMAATLALSRLVGMHCPGLHSIFGQATVRFDESLPAEALNYRVEEADERYSRVVIGVKGGSIQGQLLALFRPRPQPQATMVEVAQLIKPGSFAESHALIVGGSRGLGEITAKIIAAGGGVPIITYHHGAADAERVADEIRAYGGSCETMQLDVMQSGKAVRELNKNKNSPKSLYYFATPRIGLRKGFFSHQMLGQFHEIYVTSFGNLLDALATGPTKLRVFYPSSVFVNERPPEMAEYVIAKQSGEGICAFYNRHSTRIEILVKRLPRMRTDQTNSVLNLPAENALDVMLPIVRDVEDFTTVLKTN